MVISDYHAAFCDAFRRTDVTLRHLHSLRKRKGWKVGRDGGRYVGRRRRYSAAEVDWLREACTTMTPADCHRAFCERFERNDVTASQLLALRKGAGIKTGRDGRFQPGSVSHNKGKKMPFNANSARTQFKKGQQPANAKYAGHERISSDGYVYISIDERNPYTGFERRYVHKHRWLWEKLHGPVPDGMVLKCLGDKRNTDPSNWELVPRAILSRLNGRHGRGYDEAPDELKPTIMAVAKLEHQLRQARSGEAATSAPKAGGAPPAGRAKRGRTSGASSRQSAFSPSRPGDE